MYKPAFPDTVPLIPSELLRSVEMLGAGRRNFDNKIRCTKDAITENPQSLSGDEHQIRLNDELSRRVKDHVERGEANHSIVR